MDAAAVIPSKRSQLLLEHCLAFHDEETRRPPAAARLEALLGRDLARRLVRALCSRAD